MADRVPPKRLYKYRSFSDLTLGMLVEDTVYFATPILTQLIEERTDAEMSAAAKTIRYKGPKTRDHIARQSRTTAERLLADIRYNATNPDYELDDPEQFLLGRYIEEELLRRYDRGVFSLAERANCPLMWSHYGDQHRGICIGYSVPNDTASHVVKMKYGGSRLVQASEVASMLEGDLAARRRVDEAVLLKKARPWAYEREWRLLGDRGVQKSPLELEEVIFGMRCPTAVVFTVIQALAGRDRPVRFYEIRGQHGRFLLDKRVANTDELLATFPRRSLSIYERFRNLADLDATGQDAVS